MIETIQVEGISCGHCVETLDKALKALGGVARVNVDLENKKVEVEFDENRASLQALRTAIVDAGFEVAEKN
ncbi:MAG: heavy-metal-associated domain-containing protein [Nitrospinaceae bacterium]|nr:MAG: heavy-metal-associated domain-containing protein [Nitrospinaceae bacterium]